MEGVREGSSALYHISDINQSSDRTVGVITHQQTRPIPTQLQALPPWVMLRDLKTFCWVTTLQHIPAFSAIYYN